MTDYENYAYYLRLKKAGERATELIPELPNKSYEETMADIAQENTEWLRIHWVGLLALMLATLALLIGGGCQ